MKKVTILFILITFISSNCQKTSPKIIKQDLSKDKMLDMNNYAVQLSSGIEGDNKDSLIKALKIVNKILNIDSSYFDAKINKLGILIKLREREQAISLLDNILEKYNNIGLYHFIKANILEKLNRNNESLKEYQIASTLYQADIKKNPENINLKTTLLIIHGFTQSAESVRAEYEALKKEHPSEPKVTMMEEIIIKFNKEKILEMY